MVWNFPPFQNPPTQKDHCSTIQSIDVESTNPSRNTTSPLSSPCWNPLFQLQNLFSPWKNPLLAKKKASLALPRKSARVVLAFPHSAKPKHSAWPNRVLLPFGEDYFSAQLILKPGYTFMIWRLTISQWCYEIRLDLFCWEKTNHSSLDNVTWLTFKSAKAKDLLYYTDLTTHNQKVS